MTLKELYSEYMHHVKITKRKDTLRYYKHHLKIIVSFINNRTSEVELIGKEDFYSYIRSETKVLPNTVNKRLKTFKAMLRWGVEQDYLKEEHKLLNFRLLKEQKPVTKSLTREEIRKVHAYLCSNELCIWNIATRILIQTGARLTELLNIKIENISHDSIFLEHTKTGRTRVVPITYDLYKLIKTKHFKDKGFLFFNSTTGTIFTDDPLRNYLSKIKKELNFDKLNPHCFRHTFATLTLQNGANISVVKDILGHSTIATTQIYLHNTEDYLKKQHALFNPLT